MTTIAWDGKTLAADSQITTKGGTRDGTAVKAVKHGRVIGAAAGPFGSITTFLDWVRKGCVGDPPSVHEDMEGLLIAPGYVLALEEGGRFARMNVGATAIGSGARIALGAMEAGATAEEAVRIASRRDAWTGGDITVLHLQ